MRELGTDLVSLGVQSLEVAVRAESVREVLGSRPWMAVPGARQELPGVVIWGGRAVAMLDLPRFQAGMLCLSPGESRARLIIVSTPGGNLALPVDRVSEVWRTHDDNLKPRALHDFELSRCEIIRGDVVQPLFDPELLLARLEVRA